MNSPEFDIFFGNKILGTDNQWLTVTRNDFRVSRFFGFIFCYYTSIASAGLIDLNWEVTLILFGVKKYPKTTGLSRALSRGLCHCSFGGFPPLWDV